MGKNEITSAIVDGLLKALITGGVLTATLAAPNSLQAFDKPIRAYFNKMDRRAREREYRRLLRNMKKQGLIKYQTREYEHGIHLTKAGRKRAEKAIIEQLVIARPDKWDRKWRLVLFDIPETDKQARDHFTQKLKDLGFRQLQRSAWIHPYSCRDEIAAVTHQYGISRYVSCLEISFIEEEDKLKERFPFKI